MRKLVVILIISCLFINIIGYHIIFYFWQQEIKLEMKKRVLAQPANKDENDFIFSLNDKAAITKLEWENDDEFSFNGEMYDVIETKIENNTLLIRSLSDKRETALIKKYAGINNENNSKSKSALLLKLISNSYLFTPVSNSLAQVPVKPSRILFQSQIIPSIISDVLTPPPQVI